MGTRRFEDPDGVIVEFDSGWDLDQIRRREQSWQIVTDWPVPAHVCKCSIRRTGLHIEPMLISYEDHQRLVSLADKMRVDSGGSFRGIASSTYCYETGDATLSFGSKWELVKFIKEAEAQGLLQIDPMYNCNKYMGTEPPYRWWEPYPVGRAQ